MSVALSLRDREAAALRAELGPGRTPELACVAAKLDRALRPADRPVIPGQTTIDECLREMANAGTD